MSRSNEGSSRGWVVGAAAAGLLATGCSLKGPDREAAPAVDAAPEERLDQAEPAGIAPRVGREAMLDAAIDRIHFAFRADGRQFRAGHATHAVAVDAGRVTMIPFDHTDRVLEGAPLSFETYSVVRGDEVLDAAAPATHVLDSGRLAIQRGAVREELRNSEDGVEQSWRFETAPAGEGDLVVKVGVSGHPFVGETTGGLHFATAGRLGFRYSHATWVTADGDEVAVPATYVDGTIEMVVPAELVETSRFPAVLDPTVSAETAVDAAVVGGTGARSRSVSIAYSGTQYLVAFRDDRNSLDSDIFATRVDAAGNALDALGIVVSTAAGIQDNPVVAAVGTGFVVAFEDHLSPDAAPNLLGATVSAAGAVAQLGAIASTAASESLPSIAQRGAEALVVWQSDTDVRGARFTGGAFGAAFNIAAAAATEADPAVSADPAGNYLVSWSEGAADQNLRGQLVTSAGALSGAVFDIAAGAGVQSEASGAFNGTNHVVAWTNNNAGREIFAARVSPAGVVLDTHAEGLATFGGVALTAAADNQQRPAVACNTTCLVTWQDRRTQATTGTDVYGQVVNADFTLAGANVAISAATRDQQQPAVAANGAGWLAAWMDRRNGGADTIVASRVGGDGSVTDPAGRFLVTGNNREAAPSIARSSVTGNNLVVWGDSRSNGGDILGLRVNSSGAPLDATARTYSGATAQQTTPQLASFAGAQYLATWSDSRNATADVFAARIDNAGNLVDGAGIAVSTAVGDQLAPEVAATGSVALLAWHDRRAPPGFDILGALVNSSGAVTVADLAICQTTGDQFRPSIAFDPTNNLFLVAWSDSRGGAGTADIYAARVTTAGVVMDPCGVLVSGAANAQNDPDVSFGGGSFFLAWEDRRTDGLGDIYGARVQATMAGITVTDPAGIAISTGVGAQNEPTTIFNGASYAVAWTDDRNAGTTGTDIFGAQLTTAGVVQEPTGFVISANAGDEHNPNMSNGLSGQSIVAYDRVRSDLQTARVVVRRISFAGGNGQTCGSAAACESGFCVDGRCCDTACGGGSTADCQACSTTRGAAANGTCGPVNAGRICRNYASTFCDLRELCDGAAITCPADVGRREGQVCNTGTGAVCPANSVAGAPHACP